MSDSVHSDRANDMLLTILELVSGGVKESLGKDAAFDLAVKVVDEVRHAFGGELVYVPKGKTLDSIILSNKMWQDFRGNNHYELSKKYDCTIQWVYTVIRTMRKIKHAEVQGDMFTNESGV